MLLLGVWSSIFLKLSLGKKFSMLACNFVVSGPGIQIMLRAQTRHPLDPLTAAEISVAVATVRAAGATPEVLR